MQSHSRSGTKTLHCIHSLAPWHLRCAKVLLLCQSLATRQRRQERDGRGLVQLVSCSASHHSYLALFAFLSMKWAARQRVQQGKGACPAQLVLRLSLPGSQHPPLRLTLLPLSSYHGSALGLAAPTGRSKAKGLVVCSSFVLLDVLPRRAGPAVWPHCIAECKQPVLVQKAWVWGQSMRQFSKRKKNSSTPCAARPPAAPPRQPASFGLPSSAAANSPGWPHGCTGSRLACTRGPAGRTSYGSALCRLIRHALNLPEGPHGWLSSRLCGVHTLFYQLATTTCRPQANTSPYIFS